MTALRLPLRLICLPLLYSLCSLLIAADAAPPPATAVAESSATLDTPTGTLHGSLLLPATPGPWPIALIIAGSGPTDRNGNSPLLPGHNDSLKRLADTLASTGIASLRYDKRGIAESRAAGPAESALRFEQYVDDAALWGFQLKTDPRFTDTAIIGHSEGSLIGMLAAAKAKPGAFVSLAGPSQPAADILRGQLRGKLPAALAEKNAAILAHLEQGQAVGDIPPGLQALYRHSVQPYLMSWMRYSPTDAIRRLHMPVLIVQGGSDIQVSTVDAEELHEAQPAARLLLLPGMNHVLKTVMPDSDPMAGYSSPLPLDTELARQLPAFLLAALRSGHHDGEVCRP